MWALSSILELPRHARRHGSIAATSVLGRVKSWYGTAERGGSSMSEYRYYEFQAIDRPLTREEMAELRALSTRATITPTLFRNVYNYGGFRGSPETLMEKYFDAHVYDSNFGTRDFMVRL